MSVMRRFPLASGARLPPEVTVILENVTEPAEAVAFVDR
jgi:hypothetical protein